MAAKQNRARRVKITQETTAPAEQVDLWPRDEAHDFAQALLGQEEQAGTPRLEPLLPERHPNLDLFVCDIVDAAPKSDLGSMEHPFFALKSGDKNIRHYEHNGTKVEVVPSVLGMATIHDKDILLYCAGVLTEALNRGERVTRAVSLHPYQFFVATNRDQSGDSYKRFLAALKRLKGTQIYTNITTGGKPQDRPFGLIDDFATNRPDGTTAIVLTDWFFRAVVAREVLTLSRDYYRLRKPLEKRLCELARKHCGAQPAWKCRIEILHKKSGATCNIREFRRALSSIAKSQHLPHYTVELASDVVSFTNRDRGQFAAEDAASQRNAVELAFRTHWEKDHPGEIWPGYKEAVRALKQQQSFA